MLRFPHFLDNRLTDGSDDVNLRRRPAGRTLPQEDSSYSLLLEAESTPAQSAAAKSV
jgi:hypothetical protein